MNGAQVQSLLELITKVATGEIPESVARPIIRTAFPKVSEERINEMLNGMKDLPPKPTPPEGNPPGNGRQGGTKPKAEPMEEGDDDDEDEGDEDGATAQWPRAELGSCGLCGGRLNVRAENTPEVAAEALEQLLRDTHGGATWSQSYFEEVRGILSEGLTSRFRSGLQQVAYDQPDHVAYAAMEQNIARFSAVKTLAQATELNAMVRKSTGFADFKRLVDESGVVGKYTKRYLATEYQTAVNTGLQASRWFDIQRNAEALPFVEYWTQGDAQVRKTHADLNGKRWPVGHKILEIIAPPNGHGCRCTLVSAPDGPEDETLRLQTQKAMADLEGSGELARMKKLGFDKNKAITGEVFDLNRSYLKELDSAQNRVPTLGVRDSYGSDAESRTWKAIASSPLPPVQSNTETVQDAQRWLKRNANDKGVVVINDFTGRPIQLDSQTLDKKLRKEPQRASLVDQLANVLADPDEVWLDQKGDRVYIKFTDAGALRVPVRVQMGSSLQVRTFYLDSYDENLDKQRAGILVKRYQ